MVASRVRKLPESRAELMTQTAALSETTVALPGFTSAAQALAV